MPQHDPELLASLADPQLVYHNAPSGYLFTLPDGIIIGANKTVSAWLGYTEEELLQKKLSDLLSKGGNIHYEMFFRPLMNVNGKISELNYEIIRKDGTSFPALLNGNGIYGNDGKLKAIMLTITDITQRNLYEKELLKAKNEARIEKERFQFLADASPEMIWTIDEEGQISYANQRLIQFFDLKPHELTIKKIFQHLHPLSKIKMLRYWIINGHSGKGFTALIRLKNHDLLYEWFEVKAVFSHKESKELKWFGTCISHDAHMKAITRKDDFINIASHELKTPVTIVQSYLELIEASEISDTVRGFVNKSLSSLKNLQLLIGSLLNVTAINSGDMVLTQSLFSINQLLATAIEQLQYTTASHRLILQTGEEDVLVRADKERIMRVIVNLVSNAIKYSPGADKVIITSEYIPAAREICISVIDFGVGILEEDFKKIFERYYRVEVQKSQPGLGLGLYITQNILKAHHSKLTVKSEPGKGTTFSFSLPVTAK
ncbi:MAG: PAS domain-containing sensor histidine kinase [Ginsengibacter sp.]